MKLLKSEALRPYLALSLIFNVSPVNAELVQHTVSKHTESLMNETQNDQVVAKVCAIILKHSLKKDIDAESIQVFTSLKDQQGLTELKKKILQFVQKSQPIAFTLVGFPFKSGNKDRKVIGILADQAERHALENLEEFLEDIHKVHKHGAKLTIYTDGLSFFDLLGIPLKDLLAYEKSLKELAADLPFISIMNCQDLFPGQSLERIHKYIKDQVVPFKPLTSDEKQVLGKRLLKELDHPKGKSLLKKASLEKLVQDMHHRSRQINHIYKSKFPPAIHLSVHYQKDLGKKVGISLSSGSITPWHGVAVLNKEGSFNIKQKEDLSKNSRLCSKRINGLTCHYYIEE